MTTDPLYSFQLPRGLLRAMALFQADASRSNLACASFEIRETANQIYALTIAAVDGRRLASYQTEISQEFLFGEFPKEGGFIVDLTGCTKLPESQHDDRVTVEVFEREVGFVSESIRYTAARVEKTGVDFPSWRSVIPSGAPEPVPQVTINFDLFADFGKAAKLITDGYALTVSTYGEGRPIIVNIANHREFFGLIMPMKGEAIVPIPDWMLTEKERFADITVEKVQKKAA